MILDAFAAEKRRQRNRAMTDLELQNALTLADNAAEQLRAYWSAKASSDERVAAARAAKAVKLALYGLQLPLPRLKHAARKVKS